VAGNTEFQFKVANFNFKSTSYEWLVVSGAKARYRGVGTVNGAGSYGFELTAIDGQVNGGGGMDKFRIKIWLGNQGNGVIYDNMMGVDDGADPTTVLGGGSIVIHKSSQPLLATSGTSIGSGTGSLTQETLNQAVERATPVHRSPPQTQDLHGFFHLKWSHRTKMRFVLGKPPKIQVLVFLVGW
jgi:hypothetical protein